MLETQRKFTVGVRGLMVVFFLDGEPITGMHYKQALEVARSLRLQAQGAKDFDQVKATLSSVQEEKRIAITLNGKQLTNMLPKHAIQFANVIVAQAKQAEALDNVNRLIEDSAFMIRTGAPFALTGNKDVLEEALNEAKSDRDLRRFFPSGIQSTAFVYPIGLRQHPPKNGKGN